MAKKKTLYQGNVDWDDTTFGEVSHQIGKRMTEKIQTTKTDYKRKPKYKNWDKFSDDEE